MEGGVFVAGKNDPFAVAILDGNGQFKTEAKQNAGATAAWGKAGRGVSRMLPVFSPAPKLRLMVKKPKRHLLLLLRRQKLLHQQRTLTITAVRQTSSMHPSKMVMI